MGNAAADQPPAPKTEDPPSDIPIVQRAIVVDDDPVIRGILRSTLAGIGLGVYLAKDGAEAIAMAQRLDAGLFVLDLEMPNTNGLETCRHLRSLERHAHTPIVVLTGHDGPRTHAAALAVGATMFLTKPFKPAALLKAIGPILTGSPHPSGALPWPHTKDSAGDLWGHADPDHRNQLWGRQDAERAAKRRASGETDELA